MLASDADNIISLNLLDVFLFQISFDMHGYYHFTKITIDESCHY